ncbi:MAG: hypothetical protein LUC39_07650 [Clostridiales bacterium]|nr:hypothetical protein [Clostridiales bacterium]
MNVREWVRPQTVAQRFVANEYVAACGDSGTVYNFECNAGNSTSRYAVKDSSGNVARISGYYMDGGQWGAYYHPCGETHEAESDSGFLTGYHIDDVSTREDENIAVIIWTDNNTDVHCTTNLDMSSWSTAKS